MSTQPPPTVVPILLYHSITDRPAPGQAAYTVSPSAFAEHLRAVTSSGRTALTLTRLARALRGEHTLPPRPVLMTFDDGFEDNLEAVEGVLAAGLAASVFVTSGSIGSTGMLDARQLAWLAGLGAHVEVGAHSVTHPRLDELPRPAVQAEIRDSKAALEGITGAPVTSFAYPHGAYDATARTAVAEAGFTAAAAVKNALSHSHDDPLALARVTVMSRTDAKGVERLLEGNGAPAAWRGERMRTRGYRALRRVRRRAGAA